MRSYLRISSLLFIVLAINPSVGVVRGENPDGQRGVERIVERGHFVTIDANNISAYVRNNGSFNRDPITGIL